jgi:hypothetical protein
MSPILIVVVLLAAHASCAVLLDPASDSGVEIGDTIVGAQAPVGPRARLFETLPVGYAHRLAMRGGVRALAQLYVQKYPKRTVQTYGIGVLDPRNMYRWPDSVVPAVFQVYQMIMAGLWRTGQLASLQSIFTEWAETHGQVLEDDLPRQCIYELNMDSQWFIIPFLLSSRSVTINTTHWSLCHIDLPPPLNDTRYPPPYTTSYTWTHFRDQMLQLIACGVKKPLILEECMTHPWLNALLQNFGVNMYAADGKTSGWRTERFVDVIYDILWPILHRARLLDPEQSMIKQWINFHSPIMQQYDKASWTDWPDTEPTPIPRSECNLASAFFGASSHYSPGPGKSAAPEMKLVDSPGKVNTFQPWGWAKSARRFPGPNVTDQAQADHLSEMADDWLRFIADYSNPALFDMDLANRNIPPFESVRATPEFQALITGTQRAQINERLLRKGRPLNYPNKPFRNINLYEGWAIVSRFLHDLMLKPEETGLNPDTWNDEMAVWRAIRLVRDRAAVLMEELTKPDCEFGRDTVETRGNDGYITIDWKPLAKAFSPESDCRVTDASLYDMHVHALAGDTRKPISCVHPEHTRYWPADDCTGDLGHPMLDAYPQVELEQINRTCVVTAATASSLSSAPVLQFPCPYIPRRSEAAKAILAVVAILLFVQALFFIGVWVFRDLPAVRAASWRWSLVLLVGLMLVNVSALMTSDRRSGDRCVAYLGLLSFGMVMSIASVYVKLHRIDRIHGDQHVIQKVIITDADLITRFLLILALNAAFLTIWAVLANPFVHDVSFGGDLKAAACSYGDPLVLGLWLTFCLLLMAVNIVLTWRIRAVPSKFSENKVLLCLSLSVVPTCVLVLPVLSIADTEYDREIIKAIVSQLLGWTLTSIYFSPKLYFAWVDPKGHAEEQRRLTRLSHQSTNQAGSRLQSQPLTKVDIGPVTEPKERPLTIPFQGWANQAPGTTTTVTISAAAAPRRSTTGSDDGGGMASPRLGPVSTSPWSTKSSASSSGSSGRKYKAPTPVPEMVLHDEWQPLPTSNPPPLTASLSPPPGVVLE